MLVVSSVSVAAKQSSSVVRAELCDSTPPVVTIQSPASDSIVATQPVSVSGTTDRTSQIDIFINNSYSSSVGVDSSQTFSFPVSLIRGTNTIRLHAVYSCNNTTADESIVVSYEPSSSPGAGGSTSTVTTSPSSVGPGVVSNPVNPELLQKQALEAQKRSPLDRLLKLIGFSSPDGPRSDFQSSKPIFIFIWPGLLILAMAICLAILFPHKWPMWMRQKYGHKEAFLYRVGKTLLITSLLLFLVFGIIILI